MESLMTCPWPLGSSRTIFQSLDFLVLLAQVIKAYQNITNWSWWSI